VRLRKTETRERKVPERGNQGDLVLLTTMAKGKVHIYGGNGGGCVLENRLSKQGVEREKVSQETLTNSTRKDKTHSDNKTTTASSNRRMGCAENITPNLNWLYENETYNSMSKH
jgi:hypothetical protein